MQLSQLAQRRPGKLLVDLSDVIIAGNNISAIHDHHRAKGQAEPDIVILYILLHRFFILKLLAKYKLQVAVLVDKAGIQMLSAVPVYHALIDTDTGVSVSVVVTGGGHHRVYIASHLLGGILRCGAIFTIRQETPELGSMGDLHFRESVYAVAHHLFPSDR